MWCDCILSHRNDSLFRSLRKPSVESNSILSIHRTRPETSLRMLSLDGMWLILSEDSMSTTLLVLLSSFIAALLLMDAFSTVGAFFGADRPRGRLPPGPLLNNIPIVGYLPVFLGGRPAYEIFARLSRRYGPIFRVKLGSRTMVVISDHKLFREAFKRDDMTDRPHTPLNDGLMDGYGISSAEGHRWKVQRHFAHTSLRDLGMLRMANSNKVRFETNAAAAVDLLVREMSTQPPDVAFDLELLLSFTVANIFCSTVISKTYELYDAELMSELCGLQDSFRIIESISLANFCPTFCLLPRFRNVLNTVLGRREATRQFFRRIIREHRQTLDPKNPRDLIDAFILRMDSNENANTTFTEIQLLSTMGDLFSAGTETTKTTLRWLLLAMARKPDIQKKVQEEVDAIVGHDRCPQLSDRPHMHYTEATICETLRVASTVPMGNPHCPTHDIVLNGFLIPKGTLVMGLLWKFHRDETLWKNASDFDPENFLHDDRSLFKPDYLMPFSTGRRICVGEDLARNEIFLVATTLLQRFEFRPPEDDDGSSLPSFDDTRAGFLRSPVSYKLRVVPRNRSTKTSAAVGAH